MNTQSLPMLALNLISGIGPIKTRQLIEIFGNAQDIFNLSKRDLLRLKILPRSVALAIAEKHTWDRAIEVFEMSKSLGYTVVGLFDEEYPDKLKQIPDAPTILYGTGRLTCKTTNHIGIVGTRQPSKYGLDCTKRILSGLVNVSPTIVSGLAYGVDIYSHKCALKLGLRTEAVLGSAIDCIYPSAHKSAVMQIANDGYIWSEYPPGTMAERPHFPMRNRIIAGMCDIVLVVESGKKGGSMITARLANDYNREVGAIPGRADEGKSEGCNYLIKTQQAHLVEDASDVLALMQWNDDTDLSPSTRMTLEDSNQEKVMKLLEEKGPLHIDEIKFNLNFSDGLWASVSLEMEMCGRLNMLPGSKVGIGAVL